MKKIAKKLALRQEVIRTLHDAQIRHVVGGLPDNSGEVECPTTAGAPGCPAQTQQAYCFTHKVSCFC
jgi:hypothetical protein